ncbi:MAG TPA: alpha/beta fold hydrolase [Fimbriiglobus sp.]|nr:alpha/beta fold hydrolase [Fimbriiglobus sp.]
MGDVVWWGITVLQALALLTLVIALFLFAVHLYYRLKFLDHIIRIFEEKPLFIIPRGTPEPGAEDVRLPAGDGRTLRGCYLSARGPRRGVILFGLEFGSNRWASVQYCAKLRDAGYDVFAYEPRNQGESDKDDSYKPLQWVTDKDLADMRAAVAYLKARPDAPADGIGILGVSKGGSVGLLVAADDRWVKCVATDGAYATYTTMVPYMRRWVSIYSSRKWLQANMPDWLYGTIGSVAIREAADRRAVQFLSVERAVKRMRQPLFMIHGGADTYIKPEMAEALFARAGSRDKTLWLVPNAKHNQALHAAGDEYHRRLAAFFTRHLGVAADVAATTPPDGTPPLEPQDSGRLAAAGAE